MSLMFSINHHKNIDYLPLKSSKCSGDSDDTEDPSLSLSPTPVLLKYFNTILNIKILSSMTTKLSENI